MSSPAEEARTRAESLPDLVDDAARPKLDSVTDVNGTIARFEMAYTPVEGDRFPFGPKLSARLPAYIYMALASALSAVIAYGYSAASNSRLYIWVVEGDRGRPMSAAGLAFVVFLSAVATVVRAHMRGVVVRGDGIEARFLLPMGIPRVKRWMWPQIHRVIVSDASLALELWDGAYERLPEVAETRKLADLLISIANARHIQVTQLV